MNLTSTLQRGAFVVALATMALDVGAQPSRASSTPAAAATPASTPSSAPIDTVPGMARVTDRANLYGDAAAGKLSEAVRDALPRVYVPNLQSNDVYVIDPATFTVVDKFRVGLNPQHVVPSWDLKTLWVANNAENTTKGSLTPIDPKTGKPGKAIAVDDPYNMYFTPDGKDGDRRRRGVQAARLPRPADDGAEVVARDPRLQGNQPRRLLDRRPLRDLHVRVRRHAGQDRPGRTQGARLPQALDRQDAAGHPRLARRQHVLRRRHDGRRRVRRRRRELQGDRLRQDRQGHARSLPEPRRQEALRRQPRLEQDPRRRKGHGQRLGARLRDPQGRRDVADPGRRQSRHGQRQRRRQVAVAVGSLRPRRLRDRHDDRRGEDHQGRAASRTGSPSGRSRAATRSATPATCADSRTARAPPRSRRTDDRFARSSFAPAPARRPARRRGALRRVAALARRTGARARVDDPHPGRLSCRRDDRSRRPRPRRAPQGRSRRAGDRRQQARRRRPARRAGAQAGGARRQDAPPQPRPHDGDAADHDQDAGLPAAGRLRAGRRRWRATRADLRSRARSTSARSTSTSRGRAPIRRRPTSACRRREASRSSSSTCSASSRRRR